MPEFILDTSGAVEGVPPVRGHASGDTLEVRYCGHVKWSYLDTFTQGYIEALFFGGCDEPGKLALDTPNGGREWVDVGFSDLAPETLASIIADCRAFQAANAATLAEAPALLTSHGSTQESDSKAGRDFWCTRNHHGCGFWDGDWPEPYATELTRAAAVFDQVEVYLGDDGKVYLS